MTGKAKSFHCAVSFTIELNVIDKVLYIDWYEILFLWIHLFFYMDSRKVLFSRIYNVKDFT